MGVENAEAYDCVHHDDSSELTDAGSKGAKVAGEMAKIKCALYTNDVEMLEGMVDTTMRGGVTCDAAELFVSAGLVFGANHAEHVAEGGVDVLGDQFEMMAAPMIYSEVEASENGADGGRIQ